MTDDQFPKLTRFMESLKFEEVPLFRNKPKSNTRLIRRKKGQNE